jgi:hypothetical protein
MKQPPLFRKLLRDWTTMPRVLDEGIAAGIAAREPQPGWVTLKGLSAISDVLPPQAYANPGFAEVYNRAVRQFRRRATFSAFMAGISRSELEARLETHALLMAALMRREDAGLRPAQEELTV